MSPRTDSGLLWERAGTGPPLLLIHAGIADRTMWDPQWARWRERFSVIRYDGRGYGESADPSGPWSRHEDAIAVLDAAGVDRAAIIGTSIGGQAALDLVLEAPDRASALVAVSAVPSGWEHSAELLERFAAVDAAYERGGVAAANQAELGLWVDAGRRRAEIPARARAAVERMNRAALEREQARERAGAEVEPVLPEPPALARLAEVGVPALVITGALDHASVRAGAAALAAGAGAECQEVPRSAHLPSLERPDEFDRAVLAFLDRAAGAS